jgi:NADH pyrophosphatase NudC (nudix superfamily)
MANYKRGSHCSFCGTAFEENQDYPRQCQNCQNTTYRNPLPVAVVILPVDNGVLLVRRAIEPRKGLLAFPGGFINYGESWQTAAARELFEETGIFGC